MANLLIIDDELGMRQFLTHLLQREGHTVRVAENGNEAMAQLREQALERSSDEDNKGEEGAETAIEMVNLLKSLPGGP